MMTVMEDLRKTTLVLLAGVRSKISTPVRQNTKHMMAPLITRGRGRDVKCPFAAEDSSVRINMINSVRTRKNDSGVDVRVLLTYELKCSQNY
jgi:hypothetical protein